MTSNGFNSFADPDPVRKDFIDAYSEKWNIPTERAEEMLEHVILSLAPELFVTGGKILRVLESEMVDCGDPETVAFTVYVSHRDYSPEEYETETEH